MPPLDLVIVSHDHYDHLDYPTIRELAKRDVPFVTSLGVGAHLEAWGVRPERIVELDWWESHKLPNTGLTVTAAPSQHFSGRSLHDRNATLWSSLVMRSQRHAAFFSGDTGLTTEYQAIRERLGPFDLVMLEVGGLHPAWGDIHLGPENALEALALLGGGPFLPVHWGTFSLAMHAWDQPAEALLELGPRAGARLVMPRLGEPIEPAYAKGVEPWWRVVDTTAREPRARHARSDHVAEGYALADGLAMPCSIRQLQENSKPPIVMPPSTTSVCPMTLLASAEHSHTAAAATSLASAPRLAGIAARASLAKAGFWALFATTIGVSVQPGASALMRTLCAAFSMAATRVSPSTPCFDAAYAHIPPGPVSAATDAVLQMAPPPPCFISGSSYFMPRKTLLRLTRRTFSKSAAG